MQKKITFENGKIVVTETTTKEFQPSEKLAELKTRLAGQMEAKANVIAANDAIIASIENEIQEIENLLS